MLRFCMLHYGYYDQIGGWTEGTEIGGFKLNLYPVLAGPGGAHHQPRNRVGGGIMFPISLCDQPVLSHYPDQFFQDDPR